MIYETIIHNWRIGHSKNWLVEEEYKELMNKYRNSGMKISAKEIKYLAKKNIEEALLRWWKLNVR